MEEKDILTDIIEFVQGDIPIESRPFYNLARKLNLNEQEVIDRIIKLKEQGKIRRFGAILRHQKAGYQANAMVVWKVNPSEADQVGEMMAEAQEVSHCYLRDVPESFGYNLFTMVHARKEEQLSQAVSNLSNQTGQKRYKIIKSIRELKKVSLKYI